MFNVDMIGWVELIFFVVMFGVLILVNKNKVRGEFLDIDYVLFS